MDRRYVVGAARVALPNRLVPAQRTSWLKQPIRAARPLGIAVAERRSPGEPGQRCTRNAALWWGPERALCQRAEGLPRQAGL